LTLRDKYNICTSSENVRLFYTRCETGHKTRQKYVFFLPVSKACTNELYIFRQYTHIVHLYRSCHLQNDIICKDNCSRQIQPCKSYRCKNYKLVSLDLVITIYTYFGKRTPGMALYFCCFLFCKI
jgi:hypothetical protein